MKRPAGSTAQVKEIAKYLNEVEPDDAAWMNKRSSKKVFQKRFFQIMGPFLMYWRKKTRAQQYATPDCVYDLRCMSECSRGEKATIEVTFVSASGETTEFVLKSAVDPKDSDAIEDWLEEWVNALKATSAKYRDRGDPGGSKGGVTPLSVAERLFNEQDGSTAPHEAEELKKEIEQLKQAAANSVQETETRVSQAVDQKVGEHAQALKQEHDDAITQLRREHDEAEQKAIEDAEIGKKEALAAQAEEHVQTITALKAEHEAALKESVASEGGDVSDVQERHAELVSEHSRAVEQLKAEHEEETKQLREQLQSVEVQPTTLAEQAAEHDRTIAQLKIEHEEETRQLKEQLLEAQPPDVSSSSDTSAERSHSIEQLKAEHEEETRQLREQLQSLEAQPAALAEQATEHDRTIAQLKAEHEEETRQLKEQLEAQPAALAEQASKHDRAIAQLNAEHDEEIRQLKEQLETQPPANSDTSAEHGRAIAQLKAEHEEEIKQLNAQLEARLVDDGSGSEVEEHQKVIAIQQLQHDAEMQDALNSLKGTLVTEMEEQKAKSNVEQAAAHEHAIAQIKAEHEEEPRQLREQLDAQSALSNSDANAEHSRAIEQLKAEHEEETRQLREQLEAQPAALAKQATEHDRAIAQLNVEHEKQMQTQAQQHANALSEEDVVLQRVAAELEEVKLGAAEQETQAKQYRVQMNSSKLKAKIADTIQSQRHAKAIKALEAKYEQEMKEQTEKLQMEHDKSFKAHKSETTKKTLMQMAKHSKMVDSLQAKHGKEIKELQEKLEAHNERQKLQRREATRNSVQLIAKHEAESQEVANAHHEAIGKLSSQLEEETKSRAKLELEHTQVVARLRSIAAEGTMNETDEEEEEVSFRGNSNDSNEHADDFVAEPEDAGTTFMQPQTQALADEDHSMQPQAETMSTWRISRQRTNAIAREDDLEQLAEWSREEAGEVILSSPPAPKPPKPAPTPPKPPTLHPFQRLAKDLPQEEIKVENENAPKQPKTSVDGPEEDEFGILPDGWRKVESRSRPGVFVYENKYTNKRVANRPSDAAVAATVKGTMRAPVVEKGPPIVLRVAGQRGRFR